MCSAVSTYLDSGTISVPLTLYTSILDLGQILQ